MAALGPNMFALIGRKLLGGGNGLYQVSPNTASGGTSGSRAGVYVNMPFSLLTGIPMQQGDNSRIAAQSTANAEAISSLTTRVSNAEGAISSRVGTADFAACERQHGSDGTGFEPVGQPDLRLWHGPVGADQRRQDHSATP
ncbi:hypothetical protein [Stenotrophomonas phage CM2]